MKKRCRKPRIASMLLCLIMILSLMAGTIQGVLADGNVGEPDAGPEALSDSFDMTSGTEEAAAPDEPSDTPEATSEGEGSTEEESGEPGENEGLAEDEDLGEDEEPGEGEEPSDEDELAEDENPAEGGGFMEEEELEEDEDLVEEEELEEEEELGEDEILIESEMPALSPGPMFGTPGEADSISGFLWVDGNGMQPTDWNGLYDEYEYPLAGCDVYLYDAEDLTTEIAVAQTDGYGIYVFGGLEAGDYVVGLTSSIVYGTEYLLPMMATADCRFSIDWSSDPLMAYTEILTLEEGLAIEHIDAGMRLPMGVMPLINISLSNLKNANKNDTVTIDQRTWVVVKTDTTTTPGEKYIYLIMAGYFYDNQSFGSNTNYDSSELRSRMKQILDYKNYLPTIQAIAVKPTLGSHTSLSTKTVPTAAMAFVPGPGGSTTTQDILFAPSFGDMQEWIGGGDFIPSGHMLHSGTPPSFPPRFYCRTASGAYVTGVLTSHPVNGTGVNRLDQGIQVNLNTSYCADVPAVWVRGGAIDREVNIYHVDTEGNLIGPSPNPDTKIVTINDAFTLKTEHIHEIPGYTQTGWKISEGGTVTPGRNFSEPTLSAADVIAGTDLYLIYEKTDVDVEVSKTITGHFIAQSKDRPFEFTVYFEDASGVKLAQGKKFDYVGGTIPGIDAVAPAGGELILDEDGKAIFYLKHGQMITIQEVAADVKIQIVETVRPGDNFTPSFEDDEEVFHMNEPDTGLRTAGDNGTRFAFYNAMDDVVPGGIADDLMGSAALPMTALLLLSVLITTEYVMKKRSLREVITSDIDK